MKTKILISGSVALAALSGMLCAKAENMVTHWNAVLEQAIRTGNEAPATQGRVASTVQAAVFDAVNGIARKYTAYHVTERAPRGARQEAAAAQAAYTALLGFYPAQKDTLDAELAVTLAAIPGAQGNSQSIQRGVQWGESV